MKTITGNFCNPVHPRKNLLGQRRGRLIVIKLMGKIRDVVYWKCVCDCGKEVIVASTNLLGRTKSCGCLADENRRSAKRHGESGTTEYDIWTTIKQRCSNSKSKSFSNYGGRGIRLCQRWSRFENFIADMGHRPSAGHCIERIDNNGNYEPGNCKWATRIEQNNNTRANKRITIHGETKTVAQWAREKGINYHTLFNRLSRGWSIQRAGIEP